MSSTTPYSPPSVPRPRRRGGVVGPLVLIFIGVVFLLQNTGYLPPNFWVNLWRLWPLLLVLAGIELLFANRLPWLILACLAAVVLVVGAFAVNANSAPPATATSVKQLDTDLGGATDAAVTVRFGAGQLTVGPLVEPRDNRLASMTYSGPPELAPQANYTVAPGGLGRLDYQVSGRPGPGFIPFTGSRSGSARMQLELSPNVTISSLTIQTGATEAHVDLSSLRVGGVDMSVGAATASVRLPEHAGLTTMHVSGGASTLTLEIPQGVAARIQHHGGLSTLKVDQGRFPLLGEGLYQSADYDTAANKVDITLETGVTTIQVN
jgi:hypothetical protein